MRSSLKRNEITEYIDDNTIKFSFHDVIYTIPEKVNSLVSEGRLNSSIYDYKEYEEYLYIKYWYEFNSQVYNSYIDNSAFMNLKPILNLNDIILIDKNPLHKTKIIKKIKDINNNLEIELSKIKTIQDKLKSSLDSNGYIEIPEKVITKNKSAMQLIIKNFKEILNVVENYLKAIDKSTLEYSFYSNNFYNLLNLLNVNKNSIAFKWLEYTFYKILPCFDLQLSDYNYFDKYFFEILENCPTSLINYDDDLISIDNIHIRKNFIATCLLPYKTKQDFENAILSKIEKSELKKKDFKHIFDFDYMKSILKNALKQKTKGINILLWGMPGTGKTALAETLISELGAEGYKIEEADKVEKAYNNLRSGGQYNNRDYKFNFVRDMLQNKSNSIILFDEAEDFFFKTDNYKLTKCIVNDILENNQTPTIWTTNSIECMEKSFLRRFTYICEVNEMPKDLYYHIYNKFAKIYNIPLNNDLRNICFDNKISIGILKKVFNNHKITKNNSVDNILTDIKNSYKVQTYGDELRIKNYNNRPKSFDHKLLNTSDDLEKFTQKIKALKRYDFSLLLYGVSGSGKSYYGEYLAEQLGLKVIKKKASDLESMWVGETEKNIAKAFEEAKREKAVLIIDEGDHFISERSNHEKSWETSRTEEMLQQIEVHPYPVIFTTNLMQNIDKAAMRRFTYKTEFKYLTSEQVKIAWKDYFPEAKLPENIHLSKLCPGDFATVYKKAQFEDFLTNSDILYKKLEEEQSIKKETEDFSIRF